MMALLAPLHVGSDLERATIERDRAHFRFHTIMNQLSTMKTSVGLHTDDFAARRRFLIAHTRNIECWRAFDAAASRFERWHKALHRHRSWPSQRHGRGRK